MPLLKMMLGHPSIVAILLAPALCSAGDLASEGRKWWSHVEFLAADTLDGRDTGSSGYRKAAEYVAQEFERAGLKPAGSSGPFQTVRFESRLLDESNSSLALVRDGKSQPVRIGDDLLIGIRGAVPAREMEAPLYFAGFGLTVPEYQHDDFRGLDLRGKVVVILDGGPRRIPNDLLAHYQTPRERAPFLEKAGIVGIITVLNPDHMDVPWERMSASRIMPSMVLADPTLQDGGKMQIAALSNPKFMDVLLEGSGHTFQELLSLADSEKPLPKYPLKGTIKTRTAVKVAAAEAPNVIGLLEGRDPKLKNQYVVLSAHLDHVGIGAPVGGDKIYNGAFDNASGVASLIETARVMQNKQPARSIVFIAVSGEEKGLLGSRYFAERPTSAVGKMVCNINLDMFLPLYGLNRLIAFGMDQSTLAAPLQAVTKEFGITLQPDPHPDRNVFVRSDQYSFIRTGVPALMLGFGYVPGTAEEKTRTEWFRMRYHAPSDDASQPVDREAAAKFNRLIAALLERIANAPEPPRWNDDGFFRRFAK